MPPEAGVSGSPLKRIRGNFFKMLRGRGAAALLTLLATALMARALEPAAFGLVVLVHTYLLVMQGLIKLKPFEAIIFYGLPAEEEKDTERLAQLLRMTQILDAISALVGMILAVALVPALAPLMGWDTQTQTLAQLYSLLLLAALSGTASGILRLYNRFDLLAYRQVVGPLAHFLGVLIAWGLDGGIAMFLWAQGVSWLLQHLYQQWAGWREARRQLPGVTLRGPVWQDHSRRFPGFWRYMNVVYWQSNLDLLPKQVSVLAVGALLGPTAAGLYRLARQLAKVLAVPALLLRQVMFPDLARLWRQQDPAFSGIVRRTLGIALVVGFAVAALAAVYGDEAIYLIAGTGYEGARAVLFWLMLSAGLDMGVATVRSAAYAMGMARQVLVLYLWSLAIYGGLFLWLTPWLGIQGAGMAAAAGSLFTLASVALRIRVGIAPSRQPFPGADT